MEEKLGYENTLHALFIPENNHLAHSLKKFFSGREKKKQTNKKMIVHYIKATIEALTPFKSRDY